jgi:hypothetical protein
MSLAVVSKRINVSINILADSRILSLHIPRPEPCSPARVGRRSCRVGNYHVRANTWLVVMKLVVLVSIQHTIDLENVRVGISARELIACSIKAKNELFPRSFTLLWVHYRGSHCLAMEIQLLLQ